MSNPCIGPNDMRYAFVVRKSGELWVSRRLFVLSRIKDEALDYDDLMGQYLRDMWYMETLCPDDIREFMIIPINSSTRLNEFARTLKSCSNTVSCSDLLNILRDKYDVDWIYNFELPKHAIQKYIRDEKENEHFAFELHHFGHRYHGGCGPCMRLIFQAHIMKQDDKMQLHISNPEFQTYR